MSRNTIPTRLMGLIDGAAHPVEAETLLIQSGARYRSVFDGLPEAALGPASLFLVEIDKLEADWVAQLDRLDRQMPCLSLIWSRVDLDSLVAHLRTFLLADIGNGATAMIRFFDPRNTSAVLHVWGQSVRSAFIGPIERWLYRGRKKDWQRIENDALYGARICTSAVIKLNQAQLDFLTAHTEADELLAALIESGFADPKPLYQERLADFMPRYRRAVQWRLSGATDLSMYCQYSYMYGEDFDRQARVHAALSTRKLTGETFSEVMGRIPMAVWNELKSARDKAQERTLAANQPETAALALADRESKFPLRQEANSRKS